MPPEGEAKMKERREQLYREKKRQRYMKQHNNDVVCFLVQRSKDKINKLNNKLQDRRC